MTQPEDRSPEAFDRLGAKLDAFDAQRAKPVTLPFMQEGLVGQGWRMIGQLIITVLAGVGIGWLVDRFAHTAPWCMVAGVVIGAAVAVYQAARTAAQMGAESLAKNPAQPVVADDEDD